MKINESTLNNPCVNGSSDANAFKKDAREGSHQIIARLKGSKGRYSGGQRKIAEFVLANMQAAAFFTGRQLAEASGVSEATVTRFVGVLKYSGYTAFQKELQQHIMAEFKGDKRFKESLPCIGNGDTPFSKFIRQEIENLSSLEQNADLTSFRQAVHAIQHAEKIVIVGVRASAALAWRLWFGLNKIRFNIVKILEVSAESFEYIDRLTDKDVVVAIAFPRYLASMIRLLKNVMANNIRIISITGSEFSFIQGDINLYCQTRSTTFIANHCAPAILINALIHEVSLGDRERTLRVLENFEKLAEKNGFFARYALSISGKETSE